MRRHLARTDGRGNYAVVEVAKRSLQDTLARRGWQVLTSSLEKVLLAEAADAFVMVVCGGVPVDLEAVPVGGGRTGGRHVDVDELLR